eukprot:COSAG01_NODE_20393_length_956_cov_1.568261_1_plen_171_part_00
MDKVGPPPPPDGTTCATGCLFDVVADMAESVNLVNDTSLAGIVRNMSARLATLAASGPPWAFPCPKSAAICKTLSDEVCAQQAKTGYEEPVRTSLPPIPPPPPPPPPGPRPAPADCGKALTKYCPLPFESYDDCLACTRKHANKPICSPRARQTYCNGTIPDGGGGGGGM